METIAFIIFYLAIIQAFLHTTRGTLHAFEKIFGCLYSLVFVILTIYSSIKYGLMSLIYIPAAFFISNFVFLIIFSKLFRNKNKDEVIEYLAHKSALKEMLKTIIDDIKKDNYSYSFDENGLYKYSDEIAFISAVLKDKLFVKIYEDNIINYDLKKQKGLDKKDPSAFTIEECIIYLIYLWQLEGKGIEPGIILKKIKDGRYLLTLERLRELIDINF